MRRQLIDIRLHSAANGFGRKCVDDGSEALRRRCAAVALGLVAGEPLQRALAERVHLTAGQPQGLRRITHGYVCRGAFGQPPPAVGVSRPTCGMLGHSGQLGRDSLTYKLVVGGLADPTQLGDRATDREGSLWPGLRLREAADGGTGEKCVQLTHEAGRLIPLV